MTNVTINAAQVDGGQLPLIEPGESCKSVVKLILGDDMRPPATLIRISVQAASGKTVCVNILNGTGKANVTVDGEQI